MASWAAPGRVNLIGEHVDYNGGLVLPFALPFTTTATIRRHDGDRIVVTSDGTGSTDFAADCAPGDVTGWASYVAGVVWAIREAGHPVPGLAIAISSDVPLGAGLSSSAALTCSVASAIGEELGLDLGRVEVAELARRSENEFAGAPTGLMDQLASMLGEEGHALLLDCRSLETRSIPLDLNSSGLALLLIDTHARHELVGSEYGDRRRDCEEAARRLGRESLRDVTEDDLAGLDDERLHRRAHHVVSEIRRVADVVALLDAGHPADIGGYLTASHESLRDDFEVSCEELDVTVEAALAAGALGARMTGGGFGGCAIALARNEDVTGVTEAVEAAYQQHGWDPPTVWQPPPSAGARPL